jgi:hypothetical protein
MLTADIIAMRVWLRIHSPYEIDLWAEEYIATNPDADPLAYELLSRSSSIQVALSHLQVAQNHGAASATLSAALSGS